METERLIITEMTMDMAMDVHKNSLDEDTRRFVPDEVFETLEDTEKSMAVLAQSHALFCMRHVPSAHVFAEGRDIDGREASGERVGLTGILTCQNSALKNSPENWFDTVLTQYYFDKLLFCVSI